MDDLQEELGVVTEVAEALGISRQRVHQLMAEPGDPIPRPVVSKSSGRIQLWEMKGVKAWGKRNGYPRRARASVAP